MVLLVLCVLFVRIEEEYIKSSVGLPRSLFPLFHYSMLGTLLSEPLIGEGSGSVATASLTVIYSSYMLPLLHPAAGDLLERP